VSDVLEIKAVNHHFGSQRVLHDINLRLPRGQFLGLVGPSGCGKSTLLRAILGTHRISGGEVLMNGRPVLAPSRQCGIVYQRYSLFPFLTAVQNVAFGLMLDQFGLTGRILRYWQFRNARPKHLKEAADLLGRFELGDHLHKYPAQLSGGMCQRVAIAQALIMRPQVLLLDEPFGALDEANREKQHKLLADLTRENIQATQKGEEPPHTIIMVTHELTEAIKVADRVVALCRDWPWREKIGGDQHPGATIVYDAPTPPFPRDPLTQPEEFLRQRTEIRRAAFVTPEE
jgi:NitT/TauT family transport system ATP-binding protein